MAKTATEKTKPICSHCGSDDVVFDAWAAWDQADQRYELENTFDNTHCNECDGECSVDWVPVETPCPDFVNYDAKTGDVIECQTPGGQVTSTVRDSYPNHVILETADGGKMNLTYEELRNMKATFKEVN